MRLLSAIVILSAISPSVHCTEKEAVKTAVAIEQANAAIRFLKIIANGELKLERDTAISKNCSPKRRSQLEGLIERMRNQDFKDKDTLSVEAQMADSNFAAVLVRADNTINPLDIRIHAVALLKQENQWIPAPLLASFSNTGYGYAEETERSVKKLEAWMAREKKIATSDHIRNVKSQLKSKITTINQEAGIEGMNLEQIASYFLKQCRDKNTLAMLASMGAASAHNVDRLDETLDLITRALQLDQSSESDWHYLSKACVAAVIKTDEKTGQITIGCFDPEAFEGNQRYAFRLIHLETHRQSGKTFIRLPKELSDLKQLKRRNFQRIDDLAREQTATAILSAIPTNNCETPKQLLEQLVISLEELDFCSFLSLSVRQHEHDSEITTLQYIAQLWNKLSQHKIQTPLTHALATEKQLGLTTIAYHLHTSTPDTEREEIWMIKNADVWHILPAPMLQSSVIAMIEVDKNKPSQESKADNLIDHLRQQMHESWLKSIFEQVVVMKLPSPLKAPSADEAQKILTLYRKHLLAGNMKACFSQSFILRDTDKSKLIERTQRLIRGAHDQLPNIKILGTIERDGWVGISVKTTSKLSTLHDYPLYLFANTPDGPRLFASADFRYPRNSGRKFLNEQYWKLLETTIPLGPTTTLKAILNEHLQRCDNDIKIDQN